MHDQTSNFVELLEQVRGCTLCASHIPSPNPVVQVHPEAKILIAGQAPGLKVQESGIPFNDASGDRLRQWMGVSNEIFYDPQTIAILPMGFCYPGRGRSGDLPPRPECAETWRGLLLKQLPNIQLSLLIGQYAQRWHLGENHSQTVTETVKAWQNYAPEIFPLPHPSPRNNRWLKQNPWFAQILVPRLQQQIKAVLSPSSG